MYTPQNLGWLASVICLVFTLRCTLIFGKENLKVFLALTIYSLNWAVLVVFYSVLSSNNYDDMKLPEFLPALSGFLCSMAGSVSIRLHRASGTYNATTLMERLIVFSLSFIFLPEGVDLVFGENNFGQEELVVMVTLILKTTGFYSMYLGVKYAKLPKMRLITIALILSIYWLIELSYTGFWMYNRYVVDGTTYRMNTSFLYAFSFVKLVLTFIYVPTILRNCRNYRHLTVTQKICKFLHLSKK